MRGESKYTVLAIFLKKKGDKKIKARAYNERAPQKEYITKEGAASTIGAALKMLKGKNDQNVYFVNSMLLMWYQINSHQEKKLQPICKRSKLFFPV
jgi:hypothetical protein